MRVPTSEDRIRKSDSRVQPQTGNVFTGIEEGADVLRTAFIAKAAKEARADQADMAYVNGKMSQAVSDFTNARTDFRDNLGNDSMNYVDEYASFTRNYISQVTADAPTLKTKNKLLGQLNTFQLSELKSVHKERDTAFHAVNTDLLTRDIASINTQIQDNWKEWPQYYRNGIALYNHAKEFFLEDSKYTKGILDFTNDVARDVVTGWTRDQPNQLDTFQSIADGTLDAPEVQIMYDQLTSDQREKLSANLMQTHLSFVKANNAKQKKMDARGKISFNNNVLKFYLADPDDDQTRQSIFERIQLSKHMSPERLIKLQDIMDGFDSVDVPHTVFDVRMRIETGKITDHADLLDHIGHGLSFDTARTEMLPLITATNDRRYRAARDLLRNELGIPEGLIILDKNQSRREESAALADLVEMFQADPGGNHMGNARGILQKRQDALNTQREQNLARKKAELEILEAVENPSSDIQQDIVNIKRFIKVLERP